MDSGSRENPYSNPGPGPRRVFRQEDSRSDIVFLELIEMVSSAQSLRWWLEDLALRHALAAFPDSLDGGSDSGPPREALGCARTWFLLSFSGTMRKSRM